MIDIIVDEKDLSFNRLEKEIYAFGCKVACEMLKNILEALDNVNFQIKLGSFFHIVTGSNDPFLSN